MSEDSTAEAADVMCCANCGVAEIDDVKLQDCPQCDLARYCGDECQQDHREVHEEMCKERAAELREEILFRQNEGSYLGDCPICFLSLPLDEKKSRMQSCCCKLICQGCSYANHVRETKEEPRCPFCRKIIPKTQEEIKRNYEKRAAANNPEALRRIGLRSHEKVDYESAFEYFTRAAELGDVKAHYQLPFMYGKGEGVDKDGKMILYHSEEAAIGGHPEARYYLGCYEGQIKRYDRAVKHFIIAANLGHDESLQALKEWYKDGLVSKDDLAATFRAHQAAVDATKSPQREEAAKYGTVLINRDDATKGLQQGRQQQKQTH